MLFIYTKTQALVDILRSYKDTKVPNVSLSIYD
jgi:hypothetical protein